MEVDVEENLYEQSMLQLWSNTDSFHVSNFGLHFLGSCRLAAMHHQEGRMHFGLDNTSNPIRTLYFYILHNNFLLHLILQNDFSV